ncbi:MAG: hypothetical protein U9Q30_03920 [Campylobacterota bacterium]|nr:hypothetical protein [Campylobacterota bacterium]
MYVINEHLTHYKMIKLDDDISIRFFYTFQDKKNFENKWVLKSHSLKKYSILDKNALSLLLKLHQKDINKYKEIRGKITQKGFEKIVIKENGKIKHTIEEIMSANNNNTTNNENNNIDNQ